MIYAVDFDGYLCENEWPDIGKPNMEIINHFKELKKQGHKLILWTCREGKALERAIKFCEFFGLKFDAYNENLPELIELYGNDSRKIGADFYCDDKNYWLMP
jgi:hydroxymethylpyrimidine pyrophosphatase-like HAD family hydrolase